MPFGNVIQFSLQAVDQFSTQFNRMRSSVNELGRQATIMGAAVAGGAGIAAKSVINVASKTENFRIRMNAMLGDVAVGNQVFADMTKFAGEVPFAYEDIMSSATQLSGILKGGAEEINQTMPLIADLAAVSGLSIEKTTEQIVRMYSAGAGAADLFRERGITAMLGFEAGVSYSAEETKQRIIEAFEEPNSKFRGAAAEMATTWTGLMSMFGDKWFNMQSAIADGGLFNYIKSIAIVLDKMFGKALDTTKENAVIWANTIINGIRYVMSAVGVLANTFKRLSIVYKWLQVKFGEFVIWTLEGITDLNNKFREFVNLLPGMNLMPMDELNGAINAVRETTNQLKEDMGTLIKEGMPAEHIEEFVASVETTFDALQAASEEANNAIADTAKAAADKQKAAMAQAEADYKVFLENMGMNTKTMAEQMDLVVGGAVKSIGDGIAQVIVDGGKASEVLKNVLKQIAKQIISAYIQQMIASKLMHNTQGKETIGMAIANGIKSQAGAPFPFNLLAPAFGAAMGAKAAAAVAIGQAHSGMDNVPRDGSFNVKRGEMILDPGTSQAVRDQVTGGGSGGRTTIELLQVNISPQSMDLDDDELEEWVAGPLIRTLDKLDDEGVRQKALERSNV